MKKFLEIVQALTAVQVLELLIEAIKNPYVRLEMGTFGFYYGESYKSMKGCVGCAATNVLCHLIKSPFPENIIGERFERSKYINEMLRDDSEIYDSDTLAKFENAIDFLRSASIEGYNFNARKINMVEMPMSMYDCLPGITDSTISDTELLNEAIAKIENAIKTLKSTNHEQPLANSSPGA
jgi:hypothetical protein